uniref:Glucosidase II subunit alpha n=1 Tax=Neobodo designis TaxID=312471 RepID=A0A7S1PU63_NEODS|mmetsp:Transcript_20373/g.63304  ORF Transcript_20373/g.63304 Transcript_20373/m.63304 type:complete len:835 (+) Transcript_20373:47-2551(+)|eukprot:CAMPEP_0174847044 /NCGR_PEP_ID=MMETSP1114-20130205/12671_1 /TAXON_ID=312471 /ORGANISM="Neobodo designis, Strain CCAP 1951/1" /LENGTH=834 /DNA_ID=CAMNT_0016081315 /DNA_START=40 /DNA_END=2544 /DNA_ORIENTATION=+
MRRVAALCFALALAAFAASPAAAATGTVGGHAVEVNAYEDGTMRLRLRVVPDAYEVSDVVVADDLSVIPVTCGTDRCEATNGPAKLVVTPIADAGDKKGVSFEYTVDGAVVNAGQLFHEGDGKEPKAAFDFPKATKLYGIPEHAVDLALKQGTSYRLMNLDVFQYKLDDPGGIYGTIPFLMAHGASSTTAVLVLNSADSSVTPRAGTSAGQGADWKCESGMHDVFFFAGPTPAHVHTQHAKIVGPTQMPPLFALGYHQCRWNYRSTQDSLEVDDGFDVHNIPYDVLWLDIEHTDGKRYFTWDPHTFGKPEQITDALSAKNRKLVTITDPHIKRDDNYHVHREAREQGFYVKTASGADFEGHCWPGQSSWIDFFNAKARAWYATLFKYDRYKGSSPIVYTWIDMNEPSVFNSHEVTMDKNAVHHSADGKAVAHRDLHNMYGYYHTMAAYDGHILRSSGPPHDKLTRPFILTRSFFSGSQRYAAMWTGDNMADWGHLQKSIPMLLTLSLSNYIFVGADVGGFFNNPSTELLVRWYQTAIFTPFFRGHAHLETKRREPWLFGEEATTRIRNAIALRYALLPYLYTTFFQAHDEGFTVMRPLFYHYPAEERFFEEQNAFMFGPSLLVRPVVEEGATTVSVNLPASDRWFHFPSMEAVAPGTASLALPVTMDSMPAFLRGGRILPVRDRLRRSSAATVADPITLYVAANEHGNAVGEVYLDDTHSFDFQKGGYVLAEVSLDAGKTLSIKPKAAKRAARDAAAFASPVVIERIVLVGLKAAPLTATARLTKGKAVTVDASGNGIPVEQGAALAIVPGLADSVVIRRPGLPVDGEWTIELQ